MADNAAQGIKNIQTRLEALDKTLFVTNENFNLLGETIRKAMEEGGVSVESLNKLINEKLDPKEYKKFFHIINKEQLEKDIKSLEYAVKKSYQQFDLNGKKLIGPEIKATLKEYKATLNELPKSAADAYNYVDKILNKLMGISTTTQKQFSPKQMQEKELQEEVVKLGEKRIKNLQTLNGEVLTNKQLLTRRIQLEQQLAALEEKGKTRGKAYKETKAQLEEVTKATNEYLATLATKGKAGERAIMNLSRSGLIGDKAKQQLDFERQQIDLLRQRNAAAEQYLRLQTQLKNAQLAGKATTDFTARTTDSMSRLQERIDTIDKQRVKNYEGFTQASLQRIEGMYQTHEANKTNIKNQGELARQRIEERYADIEKSTSLAARNLMEKADEERNRRVLELVKERSKLQQQIDANPQNVEIAKINAQRIEEIDRELSAKRILLSKQTQEQIDKIERSDKVRTLSQAEKEAQQAKAEQQRQIVDLLRQQLNIQAQIEQLNRAPKQTQTVIAQIQNLNAEYAQLGQQIQNIAQGDQTVIAQAEKQIAAQKKAQETTLATKDALNESRNAKKEQTKEYNSAYKAAHENIKKQMQLNAQLQKIKNDAAIRSQKNHEKNITYTKSEQDAIRDLKREIQSLQQQTRAISNKEAVGDAAADLKGQRWAQEHREAERYRRELDKIELKEKQREQALSQLTTSAERLKNALIAAFGVQQIKRFASEIVKIRGEFEMSEVALTNIIGNAEKAQTIWKKTMNLAVNSPLTAQQLTRATKQLAAFRVETSKLYDTTKMLADVSVGLGVDMERLILAYGHTKSSGFLRGMYARQFATAGVNIYGELADYYTKLEGKLVTFRDVYERISKKLVSFADVEKVFERITSEGGTFYNMQQELTNTVQGQINKIKDTWQQALNTIGKSDQGFIRNITDIILNIVKNWRIWLRLIESTTAAILVFKATQLTAALFSIQSGAIAASKGMTRLAISIKALGKSIAANPVGLIITVLTAVGVELYSLYKNMRDYNREINNNNLVLFKARQNLLEYGNRVKENNALIEEYGKKARTNKEAQEALSKAQADNADVVSKLRKEYPEFADGLKQQANGYVELTDKIEAHNRSLREQIGLQQLMKQRGLFNDGFETDARQYFEKIEKDEKKVIAGIEKMKVGFMQKGIDENELPPVLQNILNIDWTDPLEGLKRYNELLQELSQFYNEKYNGIQDELLSRGEIKYKGSGEARIAMAENEEWKGLTFKYADAFALLATNIDLASQKYKEFARNFIIPEDENTYSNAKTMAILYLNELNKQIEALSTEGEEGKTKQLFSKWLKELNGNLALVVLEHGAEINEMTKKGLITANETTRQVLVNQGQAINKERQNIYNSELQIEMAFIAKEQELAEIRAQLAAEEGKKTINRSQERIDELRNQVKDGLSKVQKEWDVFVEQFGKSTGGEEGGDSNKTYKSLDELLSLLKTMNSEYNKLSKSAYGFAKSNEIVMKVFKESFKDIFNTNVKMHELENVFTMLDFSKLDITSKQGLANAFQELYDFLDKNSLWNLFGKDADKLRAKLQKTIDMQEVEIGVDVQVKLREDFGKEMEKMFSDYDLTLDLKKLELPTDELVGIFDFNYTTLDMLRKKVDEFYNQQKAEGSDETDLVKQVEGYYKKIDEMEKKELRERLKTYTKYLEEGQNEALKIHLEELKKMAELDKLYEQGYFTDTQYKDISNKIRKETDEKLAKNDWEQFKKSDFYITMFEDLEKVSSESIDIMIERLKSLRKSIGDLHPKQVKEVVRALEKLEKVKLQRSPLKSFAKDLKDAMQWRKESDNLAKELETRSKNVEDLTKQQEFQSQVVADLRAEYDKLAENGESEDAKNTKIVLEYEEEVLSDINEQLESEQNNLDSVNQKYNEGYAAQQRVYEGIVKGTQHFNEMASAASTISSEVMDMFDGVSDASKQLAKDIAEIATNVGLLAGDIAKAIASEGTDVSSMIDGVLRTWYIIKSIFSASEHEINWTIEKNTEALQDLETQLDRVKRARDRAWDAHDIVAAERKIENTIYAQIAAYDNLIAAEEDRKNKDEDKIRGWKNERQELFDQLEEERENLLKEFGGIGGQSEFKDMAQGFVDAWKSAFMETGDGLQGLQDHFDEFLNEWFVKQATMRISSKMLEPLFRQIDNAVDQYGGGGTDVLMSELQAVREKFGTIAPQLSDALERLAGMWGLEGEGGLSGLAAGIQGMTEEQANILEAYWNSVRGYTASIDTNVARIVDLMSGGAGGRNVDTNPQLQQMELIARNTAAIQSMFGSVIKSGHSKGGQGVKVFMD